MPSAAFANCIWRQKGCNIVIYCISDAVAFSVRDSVKESRGSRNRPMREISKTFLNPAWFPETCNRDSCWPGSSAQERGAPARRLGSDVEVGMRDGCPARSGAQTLVVGSGCVTFLCDGWHEAAGHRKPQGRVCAAFASRSPCFLLCEVKKERALEGNLG